MLSWSYISCISFYSYIKPQPDAQRCCRPRVVYRSIPTSNRNYGLSDNTITRLYIVLFLHQTATVVLTTCFLACCISFYSYIKPQRTMPGGVKRFVVYRSIPTSNRNWKNGERPMPVLYIVLFLHQTATWARLRMSSPLLYIVLFLHQTATVCCLLSVFFCCISFYSYIKPQPVRWSCLRRHSCISFYSYIKPQPSDSSNKLFFVVYRSIPTSNRNSESGGANNGAVVYRSIPTSNRNP